jgi:hypothetical protein
VSRGFAIPGVILTLAIMSITIAAGFALVSSEYRGVDDQKAQITAFLIAEQGLQTFLVRRDSLGFSSNPPLVREGPVRITMDGGYADVQLDRVRTPTTLLLGLYVIRSRGVLTRGAGNGTPEAVRTVAQYAEWQPALISLKGAWTAITGVTKTGLFGSFRGADQCGQAPSLPGLATLSGLTPLLPILNLLNFVDSLKILGGNPQTAAQNVKMQWQSIVDGTGLTPDYTLPGDAIPSFADTSVYPTIKVNGDLSPGSGLSGGRGLLIITGNLSGNSATFNWKGLVLVGGSVSGNFASTIDGGLISSLNVKLGQTVATNVADGVKTIRYNSCAIAAALKNLGALVPLNAWVDNWVEY